MTFQTCILCRFWITRTTKRINERARILYRILWAIWINPWPAWLSGRNPKPDVLARSKNFHEIRNPYRIYWLIQRSEISMHFSYCKIQNFKLKVTTTSYAWNSKLQRQVTRETQSYNDKLRVKLKVTTTFHGSVLETGFTCII